MTNAGNTVQRIDPATATVSATIPVGDRTVRRPLRVRLGLGDELQRRDDPQDRSGHEPRRPADSDRRRTRRPRCYSFGPLGRRRLGQDRSSGSTPARTGSCAASQPAAPSPEWLASRGYFVWAANRLDRSVAKIDERKNRRVALIKRVGRGPVDGGIVAGSLWVPNQHEQHGRADPPVAEPRRRDGASRHRPVRRPRPRERALGRELRRPGHLATPRGLGSSQVSARWSRQDHRGS